MTYGPLTQAWNPYFNKSFYLIINFLLTSTIMKTEASYILQHSLLTREVFIITYIYKYMEDFKMILNYEEF